MTIRYRAYLNSPPPRRDFGEWVLQQVLIWATKVGGIIVEVRRSSSGFYPVLRDDQPARFDAWLKSKFDVQEDQNG